MGQCGKQTSAERPHLVDSLKELVPVDFDAFNAIFWC